MCNGPGLRLGAVVVVGVPQAEQWWPVGAGAEAAAAPGQTA